MLFLNNKLQFKISTQLIFLSIIFIFFHLKLNSQITYKTYKLNNKKSSKFFKEFFYNESPIGIDFGQFDEDVRNLQLLGKLSKENSLIIKPYFPEISKNYDSILNFIDNDIKTNNLIVNKNIFKFSLLPITNTIKFNSNRPYGWNDGSFNYSKGFQNKFNTGFNIKILNIDLNINPEYLNISNEKFKYSSNWGSSTAPIRKFTLGNSYLNINIYKFTFGLSNQNVWRGPAINNALLLSNNSPGFLHGFISTNRPLKTFLGTFEFNILGGILKYDSSQFLENYNLKKRNLDVKDRYFNSLIIVYQPFFLKNIFFEIERQFQNYNKIEKLNNINKILPVFNGITTEQFDDKDYAQDQQILLGSRFILPKNNAEIYFQFGWNDGKKNLRDLAMDFAHSSAYILGINKIHKITNYKFYRFNFEILKMTQTPSYLHRNAGNWYEHDKVLEGLTNQNQIMGAGSGMGNNLFIFDINRNNKFNKFGINFTLIRNNPYQIVGNIYDLGIRKIYWNDYVYSINSRFRYSNLILNSLLSYVQSSNFMWINNNKINNIFATVNLTYLW